VLEVFDRIIPDAQGRTRYHYVLVDFLCRRISGDAAPASDVSELRWITAAELETFTIADSAANVLRKGFQRCRP
jgi:8-oxo-dGTP diphosphatase